jgi:hypothetical protein
MHGDAGDTAAHESRADAPQLEAVYGFLDGVFFILLFSGFGTVSGVIHSNPPSVMGMEGEL